MQKRGDSGKGQERACDPVGKSDVIPDFFRFIIVLAVLAGAVYGGAYALGTYPPEPSDVIRSLPHEKLRQG